MPDPKGINIQLTEEQKKLMREVTGTEHESIRVEVGTRVAPAQVTRTPGGRTPGGRTPGGRTPGGRTPGGRTPGGRTPGGRTPGGRTPGGRGV
jgi:transcription elongation factor